MFSLSKSFSATFGKAFSATLSKTFSVTLCATFLLRPSHGIERIAVAFQGVVVL